MDRVVGRLRDKVAIVTGASTVGPGFGNGKATAVQFAREGARVLCVDRSGRSHETAELITSEGGDAEAFRADVTAADEVQGMVAHCVERFGRVDILHNNVGIDRVGGPVETSEASWDEVIRINLTSQFLTCKYILPVMERQHAGVIIQFTQTVALQYARKGIRANTIVLGVVRTPALATWVSGVANDPQQLWQHLDDSTSRGRIGDAWDAAHAAVFLASDEANYINGTTIVIDGGLSATMGI